jgi:hypothetical protein
MTDEQPMALLLLPPLVIAVVGVIGSWWIDRKYTK